MNLQNLIERISSIFRFPQLPDALSIFFITLALAFGLFRHPFPASIFLVLGIIRIYSNNYERRHAENKQFENFIFNLKEYYLNFSNKFSNYQKYKIFKCPNCKQKLRIPRGRGRVTITCQKCYTSFKGKS
jgi:hypothetical protein